MEPPGDDDRLLQEILDAIIDYADERFDFAERDHRKEHAWRSDLSQEIGAARKALDAYIDRRVRQALAELARASQPPA